MSSKCGQAGFSIVCVSELLADLHLSLISWKSAASLDHFFISYRGTRNATCILCWRGSGQLRDEQRNRTSILRSQLLQWLSCRSERITIPSQGRAFLHEDILLYKVILPQGFEGLPNSEYFTWPGYITEYFILSSAFVYSEPSVIPSSPVQALKVTYKKPETNPQVLRHFFQVWLLNTSLKPCIVLRHFRCSTSYLYYAF